MSKLATTISVNYSDPFGLCPIEVDGIPCAVVWGAGGTVVGGVVGGVAGAAGGTAVVPGVGTIAGAEGGAAAGGLLGGFIGSTFGAARDAVSYWSKSHTTATVDIPGRGRTRVDWEEPTETTPGNVHVQGKGRNAVPKTRIDGPEDMKRLPRDVRNHPDIQRGIDRANEQLRKFRESQ